MSRLLMLGPAVLAIVLAAPAQAQTAVGGAGGSRAAGASAVKRLHYRSLDGNIAVFEARCTDGAFMPVLVNDESTEVCVQPEGREKKCLVGWSPNDAAEWVCTAQITGRLPPAPKAPAAPAAGQ